MARQRERCSKLLVGKAEICTYAKIGIKMFPELIAKGFPAVYWGGKWRAHTENIEAWMQRATLPAGPQKDREETE